MVTPRGSTRVALLRLALYYSVIPLRSAHRSIPYIGSKEYRGAVTSRGSTRVALLRLALYYSVMPLRSAHKPIPYKDSKESRGVVTSRGRTRLALRRLAPSAIQWPLCAQRINTYLAKIKCMCRSIQISTN